MKLNDLLSDELMAMVAIGLEFKNGKVVLNHPRNGRVVIVRTQDADRHWVVIEVQRPDKET